MLSDRVGSRRPSSFCSRESRPCLSCRSSLSGEVWGWGGLGHRWNWPCCPSCHSPASICSQPWSTAWPMLKELCSCLRNVHWRTRSSARTWSHYLRRSCWSARCALYGLKFRHLNFFDASSRGEISDFGHFVARPPLSGSVGTLNPSFQGQILHFQCHWDHFHSKPLNGERVSTCQVSFYPNSISANV